MDLVLKLREIRRLKGLSQKDVAKLSGVGEKTISSFETGQRIGSLKLEQLTRLLAVYGMTEAEFFSGSVERQIAPWEIDEEENAALSIVEELRTLPKPVQKAMIAKMQLMLETATEVNQQVNGHLGQPARKSPRSAPSAHVRDADPDWQRLNSRN
jgi:transcriptional regulator with XRE-family HTH domain